MKTRVILWSITIALLVALPPLMTAIGQTYYIDLVRRIMILAIAAVSLNLILGYGGLVSFGHAAYLGVGAYAVGILAFYGVTSGWLQWLAAIAGSAVVAAAIGAISIRTSGLYFIMITLAFTQMLYYLGISLEEFGGDDGMRLKAKSQFSGLIDLANPVAFYYLVLVLMLLAVFVTYKIVNSRFGMVLRASKSNEARTRAIGFSPYPYRLAAFVIAGAMCGLSGALYANHTNYIVPGLMSWQQSGDLMFMVILGGMASTAGPVLGAFAFIFTEEFLKELLNWVAPLFGKRDWAEYWALLMGPLLVLSVIFFRRGLAGIFYKPDA
jgi:branched-chain amino acid transport system permease protein